MEQEAQDCSSKDRSQNSNRILLKPPTNKCNTDTSNGHNTASQPIYTINQIDSIHHPNHPEPGEEYRRDYQPSYIRCVDKEGNHWLLIPRQAGRDNGHRLKGIAKTKE